jgi:hypothetical protein
VVERNFVLIRKQSETEVKWMDLPSVFCSGVVQSISGHNPKLFVLGQHRIARASELSPQCSFCGLFYDHIRIYALYFDDMLMVDGKGFGRRQSRREILSRHSARGIEETH